MKNVPENELFSAYLDGELTAEEQAQVERLLAASPAARQLLEELRALSGTLQSLPVHKLGEDLTPHVLRAAERRMLGEPPPQAESAARPDKPAPASQPAAPPAWKAIARRALGPRNLVWSGLAVAVALLIMIFGPQGLDHQQGGRRDVALAPKPADEPLDDEVRKQPTGAAIRAAGQEDKLDERRELAAKGAASDAAKSPDGARSAADGKPADHPVPGAVARTDATGSRAEEPDAAVGEELRAGQGAPKKKSGNRAPEILAGKGGAAADHLGGGMAPSALGRGAGNTGGEQGSGAGLGFGAAMVRGQENKVAKADADRFANGAVARYREAAAEDPMVVFLDVSAAALENGDFDELLARQQIAWDDSGGNRDAADKAADTVRRKQQERPRPSRSGAGGAKGGGSRYSKEQSEQLARGKLDLVLVEASAPQIKAALAELKAQPESYYSVCVAPSPSVPGQQTYKNYDRGYLADEKAQVQTNAMVHAAPSGTAALGAADDRRSMIDLQTGAQRQLAQQRATAKRVPMPLREGEGQVRRAMAGAALPAKPLADAPSETPAPAGPVNMANKPGAPTRPAAKPMPPPAPTATAPGDPALSQAPAKEVPARKTAEKGPPGPAAPGESLVKDAAPSIERPEAMKPLVPQALPEPAAHALEQKKAEGRLAENKPAPPATMDADHRPAQGQLKRPAEPASQPEGEALAEEAPTYRVLFVLRVVEPGGNVAAAAMEAEASRAAKAEAAAPPAAKAVMEAKPASK